MTRALPRGPGEWLALSAGGLLLLASLLPTPSGPAQPGMQSYLAPFIFFTGLSAGSLALLLIAALTDGVWAACLLPALRAGARTVPLQALLALPIVLGVGVLFPWAQPDLLAHDALLRAQRWYLNPTFFVIRTVAYFLLWLLLMRRATAGSSDSPAGRPAPAIAAVGLILFALIVLFAATDWAMSLLPHWHSSTFGLMVGVGWLLGATSLAVCSSLMREPPGGVSGALLGDLGNLLLMLVLAWSYLAFMQYLTIWIADLPVETAWYRPRTLTSWRGLASFLIVFHFCVPFVLLLSRRLKRRLRPLAAVAVLLVIGQVADSFWLIVPTLRPRGFDLDWNDLAAWVGMGALWLVIYRARLRETVAAAGPDGRLAGRLESSRG